MDVFMNQNRRDFIKKVAVSSALTAVGLNATDTSMSWPDEIPPTMPPALLLPKPSGYSA